MTQMQTNFEKIPEPRKTVWAETSNLTWLSVLTSTHNTLAYTQYVLHTLAARLADQSGEPAPEQGQEIINK